MEPVKGLPKHIHMVGVGGIGLSAIAQVLHSRGHIITGSDQAESALIAHLRAQGIEVYIGHRPKNLGKAELVVMSSAIPESNAEVTAAYAQGIPVVKRRELLAVLMAGSDGIAVAGTHGKTTTAAMLAVLFERLGADPTCIVGGLIAEWGSNARAGAGRAFVLEADEYDGAFQELRPLVGIVTNIEMDHPDCYPDLDAVCAAFDGFMRHVLPEGLLIACADNPQVIRLIARGNYQARVSTYGQSAAADYRVVNITAQPGSAISWKIMHEGRLWLAPHICLAGVHNVFNATAALIAAERFGLNLEQACAALAQFKGVGRRFEYKGEAWGVTVIDDYAHHPTQIATTLAAARQRYPGRRIWAVVQPHTYSRTRALWDEFLRCFDAADQVIVMDIYRARSRECDVLSARELVEAIKHPQVRWVGARGEVTKTLLAELEQGDVLLTLGAGDGYLVGEDVLVELRARG
ncbi:MAG: UDP-N-acetylmuramate--L-alanine ligase [Chloroflexi bacterium]|nr:UDP-N-acetylmuramate--L-alanine ligase [Chloroflexota bacterium]